MSGSESNRITALEVEFKNIAAAIADLRILVKEQGLAIREDFAKERISVNSRLDLHDKKIEEQEKFRQKLLAQIGILVSVGAIGMTFVYEFIKQAIHNIFK